MKISVYETLKNIFRKTRNLEDNSVDYKSAKMILKNDKNAKLVDVRSPQEYKEGHLPFSINLPLYKMDEQSEDILPDLNTTIIVYCQSGNRSNKAMEILKSKGYKNLYNIDGGLDNI